METRPPWTRHEHLWYGIIALFFLAAISILLHREILKTPARIVGEDASEYHGTATHLVLQHWYSLDGVTSFVNREPGYSFFVAGVYAVFGIGNFAALFAAHALLYIGAVTMFSLQVRRRFSVLAAQICFTLLLLSPGAIHASLSFLRESVTLSCFLIFAAEYLRTFPNPRLRDSVLLGVLLGMLGLIYIAFMPLPVAFAVFLVALRVRIRPYLPAIIIPIVLVCLWAGRTALVSGHFGPVGPYRLASNVQMKRAEIEHFTWSLPLRCLLDEYVYRPTPRLYICYDQDVPREWQAAQAVVRQSIDVLARHPVRYLWLSLFEGVKYHFPYLSGRGHLYNILETLWTALIYCGVLLGIRNILRKDRLFFVSVIIFGVLFFSLTLALPRYRMPILFAYVALSAMGFSETAYAIRSRRTSSATRQ